jgi:hypothetical protein
MTVLKFRGGVKGCVKNNYYSSTISLLTPPVVQQNQVINYGAMIETTIKSLKNVDGSHFDF